MVALAPAIVIPPSILVVDELSHGLSPIVVGQMFEILSRLKGEVTIVVIEQFTERALALADSVLASGARSCPTAAVSSGLRISECRCGTHSTGRADRHRWASVNFGGSIASLACRKEVKSVSESPRTPLSAACVRRGYVLHFRPTLHPQKERWTCRRSRGCRPREGRREVDSPSSI